MNVVINEFLVNYTNRRTDEWGGSYENRIRLPIEIVSRVREAVGTDFIIIFRLCEKPRLTTFLNEPANSGGNSGVGSRRRWSWNHMFCDMTSEIMMQSALTRTENCKTFSGSRATPVHRRRNRDCAAALDDVARAARGTRWPDRRNPLQLTRHRTPE